MAEIPNSVDMKDLAWSIEQNGFNLRQHCTIFVRCCLQSVEKVKFLLGFFHRYGIIEKREGEKDADKKNRRTRTI